MFRVVADSVITDSVSSKTQNDPINFTETIQINNGKRLQVDNIVSTSGTDLVTCPNGITATILNVSDISERLSSVGIDVNAANVNFSDAVTVFGSVKTDTISARNGTTTSNDHLTITAGKLLSSNRLASVSGTLAVESPINTGVNLLTSENAAITNISPSTGANVFLAGSLITDVGNSITTTDVATDLLRHRTAEPILCVSNMEMNTNKKIITPRIDCGDVWGIGAGRVKIKSGLDIEAVPSEAGLTRVLALNAIDQVCTRYLEPTIKWHEKFTEGYAVVTNQASGPGSFGLLSFNLDQKWKINHNNVLTPNEIRSLFNFVPSLDTSLRIGILPNSTSNRRYWLSNSYAPANDFTWDLTFSIPHVSHAKIGNHSFFFGLGVSEYVSTGIDLNGVIGLLYTQSESQQWQIVSGGRNESPPDVALTSTSLNTDIINLKIIITRLGVNSAATIMFNNVALITGLVLVNMGNNLKFSSKIMNSLDAINTVDFPIDYGICLYDLKIY